MNNPGKVQRYSILPSLPPMAQEDDKGEWVKATPTTVSAALTEALCGGLIKERSHLHRLIDHYKHGTLTSPEFTITQLELMECTSFIGKVCEMISEEKEAFGGADGSI